MSALIFMLHAAIATQKMAGDAIICAPRRPYLF